MGIILLDDDDFKDRIKRIYSYTERKNKYKDFNAMLNRIYKRNPIFSFRIASKKDYRRYDKNQYSRFLKSYNHNFRIKDFKTDLLKTIDTTSINDGESNITKEYVSKDRFYNELYQHETAKENKANIAYEIKKLKLQRNRLLKKIILLEREMDKLDKEIREYEKRDMFSKERRLASKERRELYAKKSKVDSKLDNVEEQIKQLESQKLSSHSRAELFKEIVITCKQDTTIEQIEKALADVKRQIPELKEADLINIAIHKDEGHISKFDNKVKKNYHAHIMLRNIDKNTNKTIFRNLKKIPARDKDGNVIKDKDGKIKKVNGLSLIQDIMSVSLGMQRGVKGSKDKHKNKWQLEYQTKKFIANSKDYINQLEQEVAKDKEADSKLWNLESKIQNNIKRKQEDIEKVSKEIAILEKIPPEQHNTTWKQLAKEYFELEIESSTRFLESKNLSDEVIELHKLNIRENEQKILNDSGIAELKGFNMQLMINIKKG